MKNGKYCILIADDEKEIRDILRLLLEGEGYAVLTAEDGKMLAELSADLGEAMVGINESEIQLLMAERGK